MRVFHGTAIQKPESIDDLDEVIIFDNLDLGYSDLNTIWFSESDEVGKHFSKSVARNSVENGIPVLIELELNLDKERVMYFDKSNPYVEIDGSEYHVSKDREELYEILQREGYQAFIIEDNYPHPNGNDIAVFDDSCFSAVSIRVFHNDMWSGPIKDEELLEKVLSKIFFSSNEKNHDLRDDFCL